MELFPEKSDFLAGYRAGRNQLLWAELVADMDTAVSLMLKLTGARPDSFLLESVTGGEIRGRYSMLGCRPDLVWRCRGNAAEINRAAQWDRKSFRRDPRPALDSPPGADRGMPDRAAGRHAAHGGGPLRLSGL